MIELDERTSNPMFTIFTVAAASVTYGAIAGTVVTVSGPETFTFAFAFTFAFHLNFVAVVVTSVVTTSITSAVATFTFTVTTTSVTAAVINENYVMLCFCLGERQIFFGLLGVSHGHQNHNDQQHDLRRKKFTSKEINQMWCPSTQND